MHTYLPSLCTNTLFGSMQERHCVEEGPEHSLQSE